MLENLINLRKTKYIFLDEILKPKINPKTTNINFFIDVRSLLKIIYNPNIMEAFLSLNTDEKWLISSELLNIAAHYRHYCYTRLGKYSTFYYFWSDKECKSLIKQNLEYKMNFYRKYLSKVGTFEVINKLIEKNIKLSSKISEYLPHIYFINSDIEEPNTVPYHFIKKASDEDTNILLTNDKTIHQLIAYNPNNIIMTMSGDSSKTYLPEELLASIKEDTKLVPHFYSYILSISGCESYNIKNVRNYGLFRALDFLERCVSSGHLSNLRYDNLDSFLNDIKKDSRGNYISETIKNNFNLIDIKTIYEKIPEVNKIKFFDDSIIDFTDSKSLRFVNDYYYKKYPLLLDFLMEGEAYD
jgi:hypothetical protein